MISHNVIRDRVSDFAVNEWLLDSGAFTQISKHGEFQVSASTYATDIERWAQCGDLRAAVSQDYMCEPDVLAVTGADVEAHQRQTVDRYKTIREAVDDSIHVMPVLQGWDATDYVRHIQLYGGLLKTGMWVGVGSVCKRNSHPADVEWVLSAVKSERPDLRVHGFGVKSTALRRPAIREMLHSSDSMAWSYRARRQGRDANDIQEAIQFASEIREPQTTTPLFS